MKIKIELEREEWQTLMELVFLGEYAVNACRSPQEISRKHADLADAMYRRQYEAENDVSDPMRSRRTRSRMSAIRSTTACRKRSSGLKRTCAWKRSRN